MGVTAKFIGISGLFALLLMGFLDGGRAAYTTDSMIYISAAEHLLADQALRSANFDIVPVLKDAVPLRFYPPGFSFLIGSFGLFGGDLIAAASLIPKLCFLFLPAAFYFLFKNIFPVKTAMIAASLCAFMPVTIKFSLMALSDIPHMLLSIIALSLAMKSIGNERVSMSFAAGLLAGLGVMLRFLGGALIMAIAVVLAIAIMMRIIPAKKGLRLLITFCLGCAIALAPFIWLTVQNAGSLSSIIQASDPLPLGEALWTLCSYLAYLFSGDFAHTRFFAIFLPGSLLFLLALAVKRLQTGQMDGKAFLNGLLIAAYCLGSIAIMIAMVSKFRYYLDDRYAMQYLWGAIAMLVYLAAVFLEMMHKKYGLPVKSFAGLFILAFALVQSLLAIDAHVFFKNRNRRFESVHAAAQAIRALPPEAMIVSNVQDMVHYAAARNARMLGTITPLGLDRVVGNQRELYIVLLLEGAYDLGGWRPIIYGKVPAGYVMGYNNGEVAILKRIGPHAM